MSLRRLHRPVLIIVSILITVAVAPAYAADSPPALTLSQANGVVTATATGYPASSQITFTAVVNGGSGKGAGLSNSLGAAKIAFSVPAGYSGPVTVTASSGTVALRKTIAVGTAVASPVATKLVNPIPISPSGHLGQYNLSSNSYVMANRFVVKQPTTIDRWYFAMNGEGASCVGGRTGYGSGNGGMLVGRIVEVDQKTGLPTSKVLGTESVNGCTSYKRAMTEFGLNSTHQQQFVQFKAVALRANVMYAFLLSNSDPNPGDGGSKGGGNHMSPNLNFIEDVTQMGPNGKNTLNAAAPNPTFGLDPRETTMWSEDSGKTWKFGDQVGWYDTGTGIGKSWPGAYRVAGGKNVPHGWLYMNWPDHGSASVTFTARSATTLTRAGGASAQGAVGTVTVKTASGVTGSTAALGTGLVSGPLNKAVPVKAGEKYTVTVSGVVDTGDAGGWDKIFDLKTSSPEPYSSNCAECSDAGDRPQLFAAGK